MLDMQIELANVSRTVRGGHTVLRDVSFTIEPGEMVAIVGASGAGKSSLLDVLAGVWPPTQGSVRHDGGGVVRHVTGLRAARRCRAQGASARNDASLRGALAAAARHDERGDRTSRCSDALHSLELEHRADVKVGALSGVSASGRASPPSCSTRPRALFLDEPTSGLDPATSAALMRTLRGSPSRARRSCSRPTTPTISPRPTGSRSWRPAVACPTSARWRTPSSGSARGATPTSTTGWSPTPARRGPRTSSSAASTPLTEVAAPHRPGAGVGGAQPAQRRRARPATLSPWRSSPGHLHS